MAALPAGDAAVPRDPARRDARLPRRRPGRAPRAAAAGGPRRPMPALPGRAASAAAAPCPRRARPLRPPHRSPHRPRPARPRPRAAAEPRAATPAAGGRTARAERDADREQIQERLLAVVSERTGYPADMLVSTRTWRVTSGSTRSSGSRSPARSRRACRRRARGDRHRGADREPDAAGVIDTLEAAIAAPARAPPPRRRGATAGAQRPFEQGPAEEERIGRFVVQAASAPAITATAGLAAAAPS